MCTNCACTLTWRKDVDSVRVYSLFGLISKIIDSNEGLDMSRKSLSVALSLAFAVAVAAAADNPKSKVQLSAADIVAKNVAARGGLQAWRAVQTMTMEGNLGAGGNQRATLHVPTPQAPGQKSAGQADTYLPKRPVAEAQLPFVMDLARPRKQRIELQFNGQTAVQVYDGANGWKVRPYLNRQEVEPFSSDEMKKASLQADLDGQLVDYAAKGSQVELVGMEKVEGRDNYNVKLTLKSGDSMHVWIDAKTFLETKMEGQPRVLDGTPHPVEVYFRDYRPVSGLQIPFLLETKVLPVQKTATGFRDTPVPVEQIIIAKVTVNPQLDAALFSKPNPGPTPQTRPTPVKTQ